MKAVYLRPTRGQPSLHCLTSLVAFVWGRMQAKDVYSMFALTYVFELWVLSSRSCKGQASWGNQFGWFRTLKQLVKWAAQVFQREAVCGTLVLQEAQQMKGWAASSVFCSVVFQAWKFEAQGFRCLHKGFATCSWVNVQWASEKIGLRSAFHIPIKYHVFICLMELSSLPQEVSINRTAQ